MPIYEYWCGHCQRKVGLYLRDREQPPVCPRCGLSSLKRLFSTFSVSKTDRDIYEGILSDSQLVDGMLADNPRSLAEWNRRMSRGEKPAPEYEDMVQGMERGQWPDLPSGETEETLDD